MKAIVVTVLVGVAVALLWTREEAPVQKVQKNETPGRIVDRHIGGSGPAPVLGRQVSPPSLEARDPDPERHKAQDELWKRMQRFSRDAQLSDEQWNQFEEDVIELAQTESSALANTVRAGEDAMDIVELSRELDRELTARAATYMTAKQLTSLRYYFPAGLVTRVRQLHYVPQLTPGP